MAKTDNHEYSRPGRGAENWDQPINENFDAIDRDIEIRDAGGPTEGANDYTPRDGAAYLDREGGAVYEGDGNEWTPAFALARFDTSAGSPGSVVLGDTSNGTGATSVSGAAVGGGTDNAAGGTNATIAGGRDNTASETGTAVGGGTENTASAGSATVAGGFQNTAGETSTAVGGGFQNTASAAFGAVGGGFGNDATGNSATVAGGQRNRAQAAYATIAGGGPADPTNPEVTNNVVYDDYGTVGGGASNRAGSDDGDPQDTTDAQHATVAGGTDNTASAQDATIGGGQNNTAREVAATVPGGEGNTASGSGATVGGGRFGTASEQYATVGGGRFNLATDSYATVGGGFSNSADNLYATVGGGNDNAATGAQATVPGGLRGAAEATSSFVWNDGTGYHDVPDTQPDGLSSETAVDGEPVTGRKTFSVSATGGVRFITGSASNPNVTYIPSDSAGWTTTSSRAVKTNIDPVDPEDALAGVEEMEVTTWEYEGDGEGAGTTHIGPMAEDFHDAFDVGSSDEHINSINADGVAFAAIQGLSAKLDERDERIETLERENERLRERNTDLETRIAAIEDHLDIAADSGPSP
jgi:hypothetical protein